MSISTNNCIYIHVIIYYTVYYQVWLSVMAIFRMKLMVTVIVLLKCYFYFPEYEFMYAITE